MASDAHWLIVAAIGALMGVSMPYVVLVPRWLMHRFRSHWAVGEWHHYFFNYEKGVPTLKHEKWTIRGGFLARFESCRISKANMRINTLRPADTVVFDGCHLQDIFDDPVGQAEHMKGVAFVNCAVLRYDKEVQGWPPAKKDLNDLFPDWKDRINE